MQIYLNTKRIQKDITRKKNRNKGFFHVGPSKVRKEDEAKQFKQLNSKCKTINF